LLIIDIIMKTTYCRIRQEARQHHNAPDPAALLHRTGTSGLP
jgi:hypothetical protein